MKTHILRDAADQLVNSVDAASPSSRRSVSTVHAKASRAINAFLERLSGWPDAVHELERRAGMIAILGAEGGRLHASREAAVGPIVAATLDGQERERLQLLLDGSLQPTQLQEIDRWAALLERLLEAQLTPDVQSLAQQWLTACQEIQSQADGLHVDGCWLLLQHLRVMRGVGDDIARSIQALTRSQIGYGNLALIRDAITSLMGVIEISAIAAHTNRPKGRAKGRPPASEKQLEADRRLSERWMKAREAGVRKKDFCREAGLRSQQLDRVLDRMAKRASRGRNSTLSELSCKTAREPADRGRREQIPPTKHRVCRNAT